MLFLEMTLVSLIFVYDSNEERQHVVIFIMN